MNGVKQEEVKALTWRVLLAFLFSIVVVQPAIIYYNLISNLMLPISAWLVIILWAELARAMGSKLTKQELFLLLVFQPIATSYALFFLNFIRNMYYATSIPARELGIAQYVPDWWVPTGKALEEVLNSRFVFMHSAWVVPIGLALGVALLGLVSDMVLGYLCYQVFVVTEKLSFPAASIQINSIVTLAERPTDRIRILMLSAFAGALIHLIFKFLPFVFGPFLYGGLVAYTTGVTTTFDFTPYLDYILPGAGFVIPFDPLWYIPGFVLPLSITICQFIGAFLLYVVGTHIITLYDLWPPESKWATGWGYWVLQYRAMLYFYVSLLIGFSLATTVASLVVNPKPILRSIRNLSVAARRVGASKLSSPLLLLLFYMVSLSSILFIVWYLTDFRFPIWILAAFLFFGSFFVTYISTASVGVTFSGFNIPYLRELIIYYSGYPYKDIWFAPIPLSISAVAPVGQAVATTTSVSIGGTAIVQGLFQADIVGVKHRDYFKAYIILVFLGLASSFLYTQMFWWVSPIPSSAYPATIINWPVNALSWARMQAWVWTGYLFRKEWIMYGFGSGFAAYVVLFFLLKSPYLLISTITGMFMGVPSALGQLIGSAISHKILGPKVGLDKWRQYVPLITMGYILGDGLMETLRVIMILIAKSLWLLPF